MSWQPRPEHKPEPYPDGRDWRCPSCHYSEPEDARPSEPSCPTCGTRLRRVKVRQRIAV